MKHDIRKKNHRSSFVNDKHQFSILNGVKYIFIVLHHHRRCVFVLLLISYELHL